MAMRVVGVHRLFVTCVVGGGIVLLTACGGGGGAKSVSLGGKVSGLADGVSVELALNNSVFLELQANGQFNFPGTFKTGTNYTVSIKNQPNGQSCTVGNSSGVVREIDTNVIDVKCADGDLARLDELGVQSLWVAENPKYLIVGEKVSAPINVVYAPGVQEDDIEISAISGPFKRIERSADGRLSYGFSTAGMKPGNYEWSIRVKNKKENKQAIVSGVFTVVALKESKTLQVAASGAYNIQLQDGSLLKLSANSISAPVAVDVRVGDTPSGALLDVKFSRSIENDDIVMALPRGSDEYDPYLQLAERSESKSVADLLNNGLKKAARAMRATANYVAGQTPVVNQKPYSKDGEMALNQETGLGQVVFRGGGAPFLSGWVADYRLYDYEVRAKKDFQVTYRVPYEVNTSIVGDISLFDWKVKEPVLFVHGFAGSVGGGEGTWGKFPQLVQQTSLSNGSRLVAFEFHWATNQSFRLAADDLAEAIRAVHKITGKKVHVIAHSFGGLLTRTVLQSQSKGNAVNVDISEKIASFMTLGTPHSGIADEDHSIGSVTLPKGQDAIAFKLCWQISCFEAGEKVDFSDVEKRNFGLIGEFSDVGRLPAKLAETVDVLPAIPIYVGIGLSVATNQNRMIDGVSVKGDVVGKGDYLISFAGQRFSPKSTFQADADVLMTQTKVGRATVTEALLGLPPATRPGDFLVERVLPSARASGYFHSASTGVGNVNSSDGGKYLSRGLEAAPYFECDISAVTCSHASYALFRDLMGDRINVSNVELRAAQALPPMRLKVKHPSLWLSWEGEQLAAIEKMIRDAEAAGIVSGRGIEWNRLPYEQQRAALANLSVIPDTSSAVIQLMKADYTEQIDQLRKYQQEQIVSALWSATNKALFLDKSSAQNFFNLLSAEYKAVLGALRVAFPETGYVEGLKNAGQSIDSKSKWIANVEALKKAGVLVDFVKNCNHMAVTDYLELESKIASGGDVVAADVIKYLTIPLECAATSADGLEFGTVASFVKIFSGSVKLNDGSSVKVMQAVIDIAGSVMDVVPFNNPAYQRVRGLIDVVSAAIDAWSWGNDIADASDQYFIVEQEKIMDVTDRAIERLQRRRVVDLLYAKSADLYEARMSDINTDVSAPTFGQKVSIWLTAVVNGVKEVIFSINGGAYTLLANILSDGSSTKVQVPLDRLTNKVTVMYNSSTGGSMGVDEFVIDTQRPIESPVVSSADKKSDGSVVVTGTASSQVLIRVTWPDGQTKAIAVSEGGEWTAQSVSTSYAVGSLIKVEAYSKQGTSEPVWIRVTGSSVVRVSKIPDTGISQCYAAGSDELVSCTSAAAKALNPAQDGMTGRDVTSPNNADGKLGFSYTKIAADGSALPASASTWACVKDNITGLMWEVKTADGGLRGMDNTYTNYGDRRSGDASAFVAAVNAAGLCGKKDWRLPTFDELQGLVDYGVDHNTGKPMIDETYFPNTVNESYWTSSPLVGYSDNAWYVNFGNGRFYYDRRYDTDPVRLVR